VLIHPGEERIMSTAARTVAALAASAGLVLGFAAPATAAGGRPFTVDLTGAAEVPGPGDPDGSGTAHVTVNPGTREVCWEIEVSGIDDVLAAHIHVAPAGVAGPVVVPLNPYTDGCASVSRELALALLRSPDEYYVNVHTVAFPAGALRGQLG
jgi:hypothetical protein